MADAGRYLSKIETDMLRGEWADPPLGRTSFNEWADRWLDSTVNLRANTKAGYRSILIGTCGRRSGRIRWRGSTCWRCGPGWPSWRPMGLVRPPAPKRLARYTARSPEAFVFLSSQGKHLRRSNFNRRVWQPAVKAAGVEGLRVHDLRHTAGTLATAAGGSLRKVMDRLGHSTTVAAVRYQHVMADRDAVIARELNRLIEGTRAPLWHGDGTQGRETKPADATGRA
jgi:hypothetical protein